MEFVFVCPNTHKAFSSDTFKIIDNNGIITDLAGNKILDAKVALKNPCPYCGERHLYHATDLSCPFLGKSAKDE